ncbi:MAG: phage head-tail joining protein [Planctomycetaceae bacterium]
MADLTTLKSRRDALEAAIASGVLSISVDGQSTTFASLSQLRSVLRSINDEIATCTGQDRRRPRAAQVYLGGFQ